MTANHDCFCELAPFYALGALEASEQQWIEQQIAENPELAKELAEYEAAATMLPYAVPPQPMAADLKDRLFAGLGLTVPEPPPPVVEPEVPPFWMVRSQNIRWRPHPAPGIQVAIFYTDRIKREFSGLLKAEPGARYPRHRHAAVEEIYMLQGDLIIEGQTYGAGDYIRSHPGSVHGPHTEGGCLFFFHTSLDDEYDLEALDD